VMERIMDPAHTFEIYDVMAEGEFYGMQTFDQSLVALVMEGLITEDEARMASTTPHDFSLAMKAARMKAAAAAGADLSAATG
jgi:twitching motility protein PilT